jgi:rhodanese-related sulfurtransferase
VETIPLVTADQLGDRPVLDVRQYAEFTAGHLPHASHRELGRLDAAADSAPVGTVVMCGHGERAMTAASLLARSGSRDLAVLVGGADDWVQATGRKLEEGL